MNTQWLKVTPKVCGQLAKDDLIKDGNKTLNGWPGISSASIIIGTSWQGVYNNVKHNR